MTALTPTEQATVTRFAIHDPEILSDLEEATDWEPVTCDIQDCGEAATWRIAVRCCGNAGLKCGVHKALHRSKYTMHLVFKAGKCADCGFGFPAGSMYDDVFEVGEL